MSRHIEVALVTDPRVGSASRPPSDFSPTAGRVACSISTTRRSIETYNSLAKSDAVIAIHCDVADAEGVARALAIVAEKFGRLDALVNNAAIALFKPILEVTY